MKEVIVTKIKDKEVIITYFDTFVPSVGDFIQLNEKEMFVVKARILHPYSDKIILVGEIN